MRLFFVRHGVAEDVAPSGLDADRRLTPEGIREVEVVAACLAALDLRLDAILSSPLVRARQTAEIVAKALGMRDRLSIASELAHGFGIDALQRLLASEGEARRVMLVGHEPTLSETIRQLVGGGTIHMGKAACAVVKAGKLAPGNGVLEMLLPASAAVSLHQGKRRR